jgi:hypothetical protein
MVSENLLDTYRNEEFAREAFRIYRSRKGIECKKCGSQHHYWLKAKEQFQCKRCKFRTTLRSGTVLEGSKLPVSYFFITLYLLLEKGNKLTIDELQKITNHKYYEPLWMLLRKIKVFHMQNDTHSFLLNLTEVIREKLPLKPGNGIPVSDDLQKSNSRIFLG